MVNHGSLSGKTFSGFSGTQWDLGGTRWDHSGNMVGTWWECGAIIMGGSWEDHGRVMGGTTTHLWLYPGKSAVKWWKMGQGKVKLAIGYWPLAIGCWMLASSVKGL
ncbi:MAG: hypothetical protein H7X99_01040 [Saprospiraceae bacterium]|nr:hypothetical protein [Saprospiraceae bacterium]